jgi:hypothetical protein
LATNLGEVPVVALRVILSTIGMFFLQANYTLFAEWMESNTWLQLLFWSSHLSAVVAVQTAIISLFGRKVMDYIRQRFGKHNFVYIIRGNAQNALMLGENITLFKKDDALIIIFIEETDNAKSTYEKAAHFNGIVQVPDKTHDITYHLRKSGLGQRYARKRKYNIILMIEDNIAPNEAQKIADYAKDSEVNTQDIEIFVLTSSRFDVEKVEDITLMIDDEEQKRKYPYTFNIINEVDQIARQMINRHPPYECKNLFYSDEAGRVKRAFTVLILGFGAIGQQALLHLIINGQFVGDKMNVKIFDKDIRRQYYCFKQRYPEIEQSCEIEISECIALCKDVYDHLDKTENIDYIVISLGVDKKNRQAAIDLYQYFKRKEFDNKQIPFIAVHEENGAFSKIDNNEKMFSFGSKEDIYLDSVIRFEESNAIAKALCDNEVSQYAERTTMAWERIEWSLQETYRFTADTIETILRLLNTSKDEVLNRRELLKTNDKSAALTDDNDVIDTLAQVEHLRWLAFHRAMGYSSMTIVRMWERFEKYKDDENYETNDIISKCRKDSEAMQHLCLVPWEELGRVSYAFTKMKNELNAENQKEHPDFNYFINATRKTIKDIPDTLHKVRENTLKIRKDRNNGAN